MVSAFSSAFRISYIVNSELRFHGGNDKYRQLTQPPLRCLPIACHLRVVFGSLYRPH